MSNVEDIYPLSPTQQGILFHTLQVPHSGIYENQLCWRFCQGLDTAAFKRAWQETLNRHPALRTVFVWEGLDEPLQVVRRHAQLPCCELDWKGLSSTEQQQRREAMLQEDRSRGFALSQAPLMRVTIIRTGEQDYEFIWRHHHLILDGWSVALLIKELFALYAAFCEGQELHLKSPPPFQNYVAWLKQQDLAKAESFWRELLKGVTPTPLLGVANKVARADGADDHGECQVQLPPMAAEAIHSFVRRHHLTLNTLLQGAWALLLSRYSGEDDVVFGTVVSGRPPDLPDAESMIGLFINVLPMRVGISPQAPLVEWLVELQTRLAEMRQYEYSPLAQVRRWSGTSHGLPLFDTLFVFENYPSDDALWERFGIREIRSDEKTNYPLTVGFAARQALSVGIGYDRHRFDAASIERMMGHLQTLLMGMVRDREQRLSDLSILTQDERCQILVSWNNTKADLRSDCCVQNLFEAHAQRAPDATAIVFEDETLTYGELNRRANRLAHHLRKLGLGPEELVGICMERSIEAIAGILGVLKAGGAYVPLDPSYPEERLASMLEDSRIALLLTTSRVANLPAYEGPVVILDTEWDSLALENEENPSDLAMSRNLAYMIYTSGSTGQPKGVLIEHRSVANLVDSIISTYALGASDRVLQQTSLCFDVSVGEMFPVLCVGGSLILLEQRKALHFEQTILFIEDEKISVIGAVPSVLRELNQHVDELRHLRLILSGGEALALGDVDKLILRATVTNGYGPTEATVCSSYHELRLCDLAQDSEKARTCLPIGRPIMNTQIYILDRHMRPVPVGVAGELYIGGAGLSRGYHNDPALTAERFVPDPFSGESGTKLYRTGDLASYRMDGTIEFLGRIDRQVKIHGLRIELEEIERTLVEAPVVKETAVLIREDVPGVKRLVAYVVPKQKESASIPTQLYRFLKQKLPGYMVPSSFVVLDALPLLPSGKVDRRKLPSPLQARPDLEQAFMAPHTRTEEALAKIWSQVLNVESLGVDDSFFELGGDSLLATQVISRARDIFQIDLPVRTIFENPTVAEMADAIDGMLRTGSSATAGPAILGDFEEVEI